MHPTRRRLLIGIAVALLASVILASQLSAAPVVGVFCSPVPPKSHTPVISRFDPNEGRAGVAHTVWILGRYLSKGQPITISLGGTPLTVAASRHPLDTWVMATIPASLAAGTYTAQVCNNANACSTLANAYTVIGANSVSLRSIMPPSGSTNQPTTVLLGGSNFTSSTTFSIGTTPLTGVQVYSAHWAMGVVPSGLSAGTYAVSVQDPANGSATLAHAFQVVAPRRHSRR